MNNFVRFILVTFFCFIEINLSAQNYFQQDVNYEIHVSLNDMKHELSAYETISYKNNSPNELKEIYFHLWPNAYKDDNTVLANQLYIQGSRRFYNTDENERGYIDSLHFLVDGNDVEWNLLLDTIDICKLKLNHPLKSGEQITITTPFHVKIPSANISRFGHLGQAYYVTQWFPKPAVYDKNGWNQMPYLDQGEYYSEFGTFDVYISLPKNYVVGATGDLVDGENELKWLQQNDLATRAIKDIPNDIRFPKSDVERKTLHYHQERVHDFAWFADKRYHVLKNEVELPHSKRKVNTWLMFTNNQFSFWKNGEAYIRNATFYYSLWNGDYPYNNVTAVDGMNAIGSGMEYPNITLVGEENSRFDFETTVVHEVGHNWFFGILGSNERRHGWMDEGINEFYETRCINLLHEQDSVPPKNNFDFGRIAEWLGIDKLNYKDRAYYFYLIAARSNSDQPPDLSADEFTETNYHSNMYYKTAICFNYLKSYLGDSLFDTCMKKYFEEWKFKHPQPEDIRKIFETTTGKNLEWFFVDLIQTTKKIDYKICSVKNLNFIDPMGFKLTIANKGNVSSPFSLSGYRNGTLEKSFYTEGFKGKKEIEFKCDQCDEIKIDPSEVVPDINRKNNFISPRKIFSKSKSLEVSFLPKSESNGHPQLFITPTIGWNNYDKTMAGAAIYNTFIPEKNFEYMLMPMCSFGAKDLVGGGNISYSFYPGRMNGKQRTIRKIKFDVGVSIYHFNKQSYFDFSGDRVSDEFRFIKLAPELIFEFRNAERTSLQHQSLTLRSCLIQTTQPHYSEFQLHNGIAYATIENQKIIYPEIIYTTYNKRAINPYSYQLKYLVNNNVYRVSSEFDYTYSYRMAHHGFDVRAFAGYVNINSSGTKDFRLRMSGLTSDQDYLFDHVYLGRTESDGIFSQQFAAEEGGFKTAAYTGQSESWLAAINLKTNLPFPLPVKLFFDVGVYDQSKFPQQLKTGPMFDYGAELTILPNIFSVYFPFGYSQDIRDTYQANMQFDNYLKKIRFELKLEKLNPLKLRDKIQF